MYHKSVELLQFAGSPARQQMISSEFAVTWSNEALTVIKSMFWIERKLLLNSNVTK
jgi:hypothetical protein